MLKISRRFKSTLHGKTFDAAVVGGGHNGLVAAAYLAKAGKSVVVLERRHVLGGAAVTEEIVPGFKFSRASYLLSLLRPQIVQDLQLKKHGLKVYLRNPNSYTPCLESGRSLLLGNDMDENRRQIAQFSKSDAEGYEKYDEWMNKLVDAIDPLLDSEPVDVPRLIKGSFGERLSNFKALKILVRSGIHLGAEIPNFYELVTAPASKILDKWFESEPLKATLATDAIIGAMLSPKMAGSGYVLLHHVMGELEGVRNAWGFVEGGNGSVSMAIARAAQSHGAVLCTESHVTLIQTTSGGGEVGRRASGVILEDGTEIRAKAVLSNATPKVTYFDLLPNGTLPADLEKEMGAIDYTSAVTKINVALQGLPNFAADPSPPDGNPAPHHQCTIHLNSESIERLHTAYMDAQQGSWSKSQTPLGPAEPRGVHIPGFLGRKPMLELCLPSSLDHTLAPAGCHVMSIFSQYTPYKLDGKDWCEQKKLDYGNLVFDWIEAYAPGFKDLVVGHEVLPPPDLERIFGLTGGNIFHGAMSLDQLYLARPTPRNVGYSSRGIQGLYLCGSAAHPGGGVMGSPGRLAALSALQSL